MLYCTFSPGNKAAPTDREILRACWGFFYWFLIFLPQMPYTGSLDLQMSVHWQFPQMLSLLPAAITFSLTRFENPCQEISVFSFIPQRSSTFLSYSRTSSLVSQTPFFRLGHFWQITSSFIIIYSMGLLFIASEMRCICWVNSLLYPFPSKKARHIPWCARNSNRFFTMAAPFSACLSTEEQPQS